MSLGTNLGTKMAILAQYGAISAISAPKCTPLSGSLFHILTNTLQLLNEYFCNRDHLVQVVQWFYEVFKGYYMGKIIVKS